MILTYESSYYATNRHSYYTLLRIMGMKKTKPNEYNGLTIGPEFLHHQMDTFTLSFKTELM